MALPPSAATLAVFKAGPTADSLLSNANIALQGRYFTSAQPTWLAGWPACLAGWLAGWRRTMENSARTLTTCGSTSRAKIRTLSCKQTKKNLALRSPTPGGQLGAPHQWVAAVRLSRSQADESRKMMLKQRDLKVEILQQIGKQSAILYVILRCCSARG